jgi:hypothetical protein
VCVGGGEERAYKVIIKRVLNGIHVIETLILEKTESLIEDLSGESCGYAFRLISVASQSRFLDDARPEVVVSAGMKSC